MIRTKFQFVIIIVLLFSASRVQTAEPYDAIMKQLSLAVDGQYEVKDPAGKVLQMKQSILYDSSVDSLFVTWEYPANSTVPTYSMLIPLHRIYLPIDKPGIEEFEKGRCFILIGDNVMVTKSSPNGEYSTEKTQIGIVAFGAKTRESAEVVSGLIARLSLVTKPQVKSEAALKAVGQQLFMKFLEGMAESAGKRSLK